MMNMIALLSLVLLLATLTDGALMSKIIGGDTIDWKTFPFMASILCSIGNNQVRLCGGSIIHSRWILTAAHCLEDVRSDDVRVYIGSTKFAAGVRHDVKQLIMHESYDGARNDIALIEIKEPVSFGAGQKIRLNSCPVPIGTEAELIGWGFVSMHQNPRDVPPLQSVTLQVSQCKSDDAIDILLPNRFAPRGFILRRWGNDDDDTIICTSTRQGKGACVGDSGGPLIAAGKQIGVVSRGTPCATGVPDTYTKVQAYIPWIERQTGVLFRV